jgi:hypothetical protein
MHRTGAVDLACACLSMELGFLETALGTSGTHAIRSGPASYMSWQVRVAPCGKAEDAVVKHESLRCMSLFNDILWFTNDR